MIKELVKKKQIIQKILSGKEADKAAAYGTC